MLSFVRFDRWYELLWFVDMWNVNWPSIIIIIVYVLSYNVRDLSVDGLMVGYASIFIKITFVSDDTVSIAKQIRMKSCYQSIIWIANYMWSRSCSSLIYNYYLIHADERVVSVCCLLLFFQEWKNIRAIDCCWT